MLTKYPRNHHQILNFLESDDDVSVEWLFTAAHAETASVLTLQGCSVDTFARPW